MSATRGTNIMLFMAGVNNGLHDVAFYNSGAARNLSSGKESSLLAASSFQLASVTSNERSSFCKNLIAELTSSVHSAELALRMDMYSAAIKSDPKDKSGSLFRMQKDMQLKEQQEMDDAQDSVYKEYQENYHNLKTLSEFNSDAEMQFKTLKEAADNEIINAKTQYYNFKSHYNNPQGLNFVKSGNSKPDEPDKNENNKSAKMVDNASNSSSVKISFTA